MSKAPTSKRNALGSWFKASFDDAITSYYAPLTGSPPYRKVRSEGLRLSVPIRSVDIHIANVPDIKTFNINIKTDSLSGGDASASSPAFVSPDVRTEGVD